ncbi:hypothetical protein AVEN_87741-1 [Araneus ventricosus]|uniref:Uncharacterized protein n=1 Tax=Araneus ventricosus TaxID=182803 RepID=A0A4Y2URZ0_ARAVE|nr:hypothetical protein AVEN_87741-1 [Araneus ventricosus]
MRGRLISRRVLAFLTSIVMVLLQTWKVASQQCEPYGWEESFTGIRMASSSHVWFPDLRDKLSDHLGDKFCDFGDEIWDLKGDGIFSIFPLGEKIRLNVLDNCM